MSEPYGTLGATVPENDDYATGGADVPKAFREYSDSLGAGQGAGKLLVVQSTGAAAWKAMSGDAAIDKDGKVTIANGAVTDGKLASPNNGAYRTILMGNSRYFGSTAAKLAPIGTSFFIANGPGASAAPPHLIPIVPADFAVAGKATKLRLRWEAWAGSVPLTGEPTLTAGLCVIPEGATFTASAPVAGSTSSINWGAFETIVGRFKPTGVADFDVPAEGTYTVRLITNKGTVGEEAKPINVIWQLQARNV